MTDEIKLTRRGFLGALAAVAVAAQTEPLSAAIEAARRLEGALGSSFRFVLTAGSGPMDDGLLVIPPGRNVRDWTEASGTYKLNEIEGLIRVGPLIDLHDFKSVAGSLDFLEMMHRNTGSYPASLHISEFSRYRDEILELFEIKRRQFEV